MPLRRRPRSPLSLEILSSNTPDLDTDGIIASDDDLDEPTLASQRRRIEALADSYRQGNPPFILSASLRGPLDQGWVNPWRKNRNRKSNLEYNVSGITGKGEKTEHLEVLETDPRKRKRSESSRSRRHPRSPTPQREVLGASSTNHKERHTSLDHHRDSVSYKNKPNPPSPSRTELQRPRSILGEQSQTHASFPIYQKNDDDWLKKDHKLPHLSQFDPPSSPTNTLSARGSSAKSLGRMLVKQRPTQRTPSPEHRNPPLPFQKETAPLANGSGPASSSAFVIKSNIQDATSSPIGNQNSHPDSSVVTQENANLETSHYSVASSSQLPKFEYRRQKSARSSRKKHRKRRSSVAKGHDLDSDRQAQSANNLHPGSPDRNIPRETTSTNTDHGQDGDDGRPNPDGMPGSCPAMTKANTFTGEDMIEKLPSAQQIPKYPSVTDCETSLRSTAMPKGNSEQDGDTSPEAYFSTQAAVLLAQKSFQNDLDSPEPIQATSSKKRRSSRTPSPSRSHPGSITPFYRLSSPARDADNQANGAGVSTQYMIDAVTPFTVSTGKKSNGHAGTLINSNSIKRHRKASGAMSSSPGNGSPLHDNESVMVNAGIDPPDISHKLANHQSGSQLTALPFTLTGSTPPTAQDRQVAVGGGDSFNLSQAIAEAGSWLQHSFDLNQDLKQISKTAPPSSSDAQRSALSLDTVR
ncbi:hypothetical protein PHISCL_03683 [Aspergillus sclerotialis]|uniref:Uncharacterized protein n=1 Tax=Aspergillus sclerotialis TaxID=2070753 RepID=A0A3A2ZRC5_9EURO|nr:hypothetical protein PHISCL_03683 [Aspergillus sclerotialis]